MKRKKKSKRKGHKLRQPIEQHLGIDLDGAECVSHEIKSVEQVNLQRVIDLWAAPSSSRLLGYSAAGYFRADEVLKYLMTDELIQAPVERVQLASGPDETQDCVQRGLYLLHLDKVPVVVVIRGSGSYRRDLPVLEVIAGTREAARGTLTALLDEAQKSSGYKGQTLAIEPGGYDEPITIRFEKLRPTRREDIILPNELLAVVERNVLGMLRHSETLRAAGRSLRHGLLFHGPPGTGKTMLVRYLAQACQDHTVILMTGAEQGLIREACQIARLLAPSIVVLEDVDLIAEDREQNRCRSLLHDLMNEMDGLGTRAEVIFLLTTNRPEVLEPALSARPGRIDQAIEFPLPDADCRRRLFEVYGRGLDLSSVDVPRWVGQTDGVSPAFIEELLRKSTLLAAERGETSQPLKILDDDIEKAVKELVVFGGELTQKLLGYRTGGYGFTPVRVSRTGA